MIRYEGLLFALYNTVITLVFGTIGSYIMVFLLESQEVNYLEFTFPMFYFLGYVAGVILIPLVISMGAIKVLQKQSIVQRLSTQ